MLPDVVLFTSIVVLKNWLALCPHTVTFRRFYWDWGGGGRGRGECHLDHICDQSLSVCLSVSLPLYICWQAEDLAMAWGGGRNREKLHWEGKKNYSIFLSSLSPSISGRHVQSKLKKKKKLANAGFSLPCVQLSFYLGVGNCILTILWTPTPPRVEGFIRS